MGKRGLRAVSGMLAAMLLAAAVAGCSAANDKAESASMSNAAAGEAKDSMAITVKDQASGGQPAAKTAQGAGEAGKSAASSAPSGGTAGFASVAGANQDGLNRKLIYKASITMKVKDYGTAQSEIRDMVTLAGGYIVQFTENSTQHEQGGQFTLKIPAAGFSSFLKDLDKIPVVDRPQRNVQGQDVSEEYVDLESRLKAKQVLESRYLEFMQKATKTDELVTFTNELGKIQEEIERIKGRMRFIDQNVTFSTIEIRVYQPEGQKSGSTEEEKERGVFERASDAMGASYGFLAAFGQGLLVLLAGMLPILIVLAILGVPGWMLYKRASARREAMEDRQEAERMKRMEHNRMLALQAQDQQEESDSDKEGQRGGGMEA